MGSPDHKRNPSCILLQAVLDGGGLAKRRPEVCSLPLMSWTLVSAPETPSSNPLYEAEAHVQMQKPGVGVCRKSQKLSLPQALARATRWQTALRILHQAGAACPRLGLSAQSFGAQCSIFLQASVSGNARAIVEVELQNA